MAKIIAIAIFIIVIGIDTNIEVIVVSLTSSEAHHSPRAKPEGSGELPRSLMRQQWPKLRYQFLFYHDETKWMMNSSSSSNFISRRIQYYTFHTHNSSTISQMYSSGGCQRSSVAHRADNRYFNNDKAVGKQGARGNIFIFPDVSSTLHSKYEWFNTSESNICL